MSTVEAYRERIEQNLALQSPPLLMRYAVTEGGDKAGLDFGVLRHVSPVQWDNVALYGA